MGITNPRWRMTLFDRWRMTLGHFLSDFQCTEFGSRIDIGHVKFTGTQNHIFGKIQDGGGYCLGFGFSASRFKTCNFKQQLTLFVSMNFALTYTSVWNSLPEAVRSSTSLALFRKSLKTKLFTRSYTD